MGNKVTIITDSTSDLNLDTYKEKDIKVIPLHVNFDDASFDDGINIDTAKLYSEVEARNQLPKTAAVSPSEFIDIFKKEIDKGNDCIYLGIGSKLSRTYMNAIMAKDEFPEGRIFIIDSCNLSSAIGLLVLKACKFRDEGLSAKEIADKVTELVPNVRAEFAIKTMDYLYKGGRCKGITALIGTILRIKPIIRVSNGEMDVCKKPRGLMKVALEAMVDDLVADINNYDHDCVMITHSMGDDSAVYLKERLKGLNIENVMETQAGCVISSHCGKGTIGILYIYKQ